MKAYLALTLALSLAACSSQPTRYYTLHQTSATPTPPGSYTHTLGLGPVFLPEALNQPGIVTYSQGQEVIVSGYNIWAGYPNQAVTRVLTDNLSILLGADTVWPFPWDNRARPARQVRVVIEEMAGERGKHVTLQAKWTLLANNGETLLAAERTRLRVACDDDSYGAYVKAVNQAINQLSEQMAKTLKAKQ